jgi:hypothetical protein
MPSLVPGHSLRQSDHSTAGSSGGTMTLRMTIFPTARCRTPGGMGTATPGHNGSALPSSSTAAPPGVPLADPVLQQQEVSEVPADVHPDGDDLGWHERTAQGGQHADGIDDALDAEGLLETRPTPRAAT